MAVTVLDAPKLKEILAGGLANLQLEAEEIDRLNVFPVPDGDTGSNMQLTMEGAMKAVGQAEDLPVSAFTSAFSRGALLGARGNSGVILSQFFKGFAMGCSSEKTLTVHAFTQAFGKGVERAYEAVIRPQEGTILTVMREGYEWICEEGGNITNFQDYFARLCARMEESLERTPELLDVLKEAGVVDSGGAGFLCIFRGMEKTLNGEKIEAAHVPAAAGDLPAADPDAFTADSELVYGYCTEFILRLQNRKVNIEKFNLQTVIDYLKTIGNSIVAVQDGDLVKVHVHTFTPGKVLDFGQVFGEFITLKIENMAVQHNETSLFRKEAEAAPVQKEHKEIAVVAVVNGRGIHTYFTELGCDVCIEGGAGGNPSIADFLKAFDGLDAEHILVLPGNSNIVMAASQAAEMYLEADVQVIPAKSIAESYAALSMMDLSGGDVEAVVRDMKACIANAATGMVTTAVRDVEYEGLSVKEGDYIGMDLSQVLSDDPERLPAATGLLRNMACIREKEVLTVFYGAAVPEAELDRLAAAVGEEFPWLEYGFVQGGQDVYDYIFAIE